MMEEVVFAILEKCDLWDTVKIKATEYEPVRWPRQWKLALNGRKGHLKFLRRIKRIYDAVEEPAEDDDQDFEDAMEGELENDNIRGPRLDEEEVADPMETGGLVEDVAANCMEIGDPAEEEEEDIEDKIERLLGQAHYIPEEFRRGFQKDVRDIAGAARMAKDKGKTRWLRLTSSSERLS